MSIEKDLKYYSKSIPFVISAIVIMIVFNIIDVLSTPIPYITIINRYKRECIENVYMKPKGSFQTEECVNCVLPFGWEEIGFTSSVQCPIGFKKVNETDNVCWPQPCITNYTLETHVPNIFEKFEREIKNYFSKDYIALVKIIMIVFLIINTILFVLNIIMGNIKKEE
jgi:hypothetical protein